MAGEKSIGVMASKERKELFSCRCDVCHCISTLISPSNYTNEGSCALKLFVSTSLEA
jgi:hypothetical protein